MSDYEELRAYQEMLMCFDTPAYMQRAQAVEGAWNALQAKCRRQQTEWLTIPTMRLGKLHGLLGGDWSRFNIFEAKDAHALSTLFETWQPKLRSSVSPATNQHETVRAAEALISSLQKFNDRWSAFVEQLDFTEVNQVRQGYNDYYVLEKECVVISPQVAQWGFEPLEPVAQAAIWELFPLVPVPQRR